MNMDMDISIKTRNTLKEAKKAIYSAPEAYRSYLCESLMRKFEDPQFDKFRHDNHMVIHTFYRIYTLYTILCDIDKKDFEKAFSILACEFVA